MLTLGVRDSETHREEWLGADALTFGAREGGGSAASASGEKCLYVLAFGGSEVATKPVNCSCHGVTCTLVTPYKGQHRPQVRWRD